MEEVSAADEVEKREETEEDRDPEGSEGQGRPPNARRQALSTECRNTQDRAAAVKSLS